MGKWKQVNVEHETRSGNGSGSKCRCENRKLIKRPGSYVHFYYYRKDVMFIMTVYSAYYTYILATYYIYVASGCEVSLLALLTASGHFPQNLPLWPCWCCMLRDITSRRLITAQQDDWLWQSVQLSSPEYPTMGCTLRGITNRHTRRFSSQHRMTTSSLYPGTLFIAAWLPSNLLGYS